MILFWFISNYNWWYKIQKRLHTRETRVAILDLQFTLYLKKLFFNPVSTMFKLASYFFPPASLFCKVSSKNPAITMSQWIQPSKILQSAEFRDRLGTIYAKWFTLILVSVITTKVPVAPIFFLSSYQGSKLSNIK